MLKDELLQPGTFGPMLTAMMRRVDIPPSAKLVHAALLDRMRPGVEVVVASFGELAGDTGQSTRTIRRALPALAAAGVIVPEKTTGKHTRYRMESPGCWGDVRGQSVPPDNMSPRTDCPPGQIVPPDRLSANQGQIVPSARDRLSLVSFIQKIPKQKLNPPTPRDRGESARSRRVSGGKEATAADAAILDGIDAAYVEVFRSPMPDGWRWKLSRKLANGSRVYVEAIDAKALRLARMFARRRDWAWGLGTVLRYVEEAAAEAGGGSGGESGGKKESVRKCEICGCEVVVWRMADGRRMTSGQPCEHMTPAPPGPPAQTPARSAGVSGVAVAAGGAQ